MIDFETLSDDAPSIILLCSSIGSERGDATRPLGPRTWAKLSDRLRRQSFRGARDLMGLTAAEIDRSLDVGDDELERLARLLARGGQLAFELDRLRSRGIWVVTIADAEYPKRLTKVLGADAPPVLFGSGDATGIDAGGIAIVGSRDTDPEAMTFTELLASATARGGHVVVSGGARGIDVTAMRAAFAANGRVVGVLPEGVEKRLREGDTRSAVASGQAVLMSPYHPGAAFSAGAAMGRNKIIYALSDLAVVVSSASGSGGTWAGAVEAIKGDWVPVFVRDTPDAPAGNRALLELGAAPFPAAAIVEGVTSVPGILALLPERERSVAEVSTAYQQGLFED